MADSAIGKVTQHTIKQHQVLLQCGDANVSVTALSPTMIRVRMSPQGGLAYRRSWAVQPADEHFPLATIQVTETESSFTIHSGVMLVRVWRSPCRIEFLSSDEQVFCADQTGLRWDETTLYLAKTIPESEHYYGFGERTGSLDKLGYRMTNWTSDAGETVGILHDLNTDPMYMAVPIYMGLRQGLAYGVFLNSTWRSAFDVGKTHARQLVIETAGSELDYTVVFGPRPAQVLQQIGQLGGTIPMPPLWSLGYHQSRWGYRTEQEVRELASEFRQRDISCDVIHLDIDYMDGYRVFTWNQERFPAPKQLLDELHEAGFHVVSIVDPGVKVDTDYAVYQTGLSQDVFIRRADGSVFTGYVWPDESAFADFLHPTAQTWWREHLATFTSVGIDGIWNDMNEPTVFEKPFSEGDGNIGTIDLDALQGLPNERTTHAEVHNLYANLMAEVTYQTLREQKGVRPFVLSRAGFAGIQRWATIWTGDNSSFWEHLELAMPQLLNLGLSGVPFVGVDIGGFGDNATPELFARWMQFGILMPFCRAHKETGTERHEPWAFGEEIEAIVRQYLQIRYRWLPYLYTLFWEAHKHGTPILRPLLYEFPDDKQTYSLYDQLLLGPYLMAAPVYQAGCEERQVYLPAGSWTDYWTDKALMGPTILTVKTPLTHLPLYVWAGACIPSTQAVQTTRDYQLKPLILDIYPDKKGAFTLYEGGGLSFEFEQGVYATTTIEMQVENDQFTVLIAPRDGLYEPPQRVLVLRIHGLFDGDFPLQEIKSTQSALEQTVERRILTLRLQDTGDAMAISLPARYLQI